MNILHRSHFEFLAAGMTSIIFAAAIIHSYFMGVLFLIMLVLLRFSSSPLRLLAIIILLGPMANMEILDIRIMGIVGAKPYTMIYILLLIMAGIQLKNSRRMPPFATLFTIVIIILSSISVVRAMPYIDVISAHWGEDLTPIRFILSFLIRSLIYFIPFIVIIKFVKNTEDLEILTSTIIFSLIFCSFILLYLYIFKCPDKTNFALVRDYFGIIFQMHGNDLANFYILGYPLILVRFFNKKDVWSTLSLILSVPMIGLLYSRAAYVCLIFSTISYCLLTRRTKYLPVLLGLVLILFFGISYQSIKSRVLTDIETNDMDQITTGRTRRIWKPLMEEYTHDYKKLVLGQGRYSILHSEAYSSGIVNVGHPHNMFLEQIMDSGLIGFLIISGFLIVFIRQIHRSTIQIRDDHLREFQYAFLVALIAYLIAGLVGRSLFPKHNNLYLWIILGLSVVVAQISQKSQRVKYETS